METKKRALGLEHPQTLTSVANFASTFANQDRWKEAEELWMQVMETKKRVLELEHPGTVTSTGNPATAPWHQSQKDQAIKSSGSM